MKSMRIPFLIAGLLASATAAAQTDAGSPPKLADYTCWELLTEPDENQGSSEVFYLGYALGRAGIDLAGEAAYTQAVADVIKRCQAEPNTKVVDAYAAAIKPR